MTCALPDPFHVKRSDARDIADEIVTQIGKRGRLCVYFGADGTLELSDHLLDIAGTFSLVGVYDDAASATDIAADIMAMQREHVHGKAEA